MDEDINVGVIIVMDNIDVIILWIIMKVWGYLRVAGGEYIEIRRFGEG